MDVTEEAQSEDQRYIYYKKVTSINLRNHIRVRPAAFPVPMSATATSC